MSFGWIDGTATARAKAGWGISSSGVYLTRLQLGSQWKTWRGGLLFANPALCSMLGFTEAELCTKHCVEFSPPEDASKDWALFEQLRQGSIDNYHLEKRFFRKDGTLLWGRLSIALMNDCAGPSPLVVAMVEDITEKKAVEETLQRSEANLQHLARLPYPGTGGRTATHRT